MKTIVALAICCSVFDAATAQVDNARALSRQDSWEERNDGIEAGTIEVIAIDRRDNTIYAATGGGVLRSTDHGNHWTLHQEGLGNTCVRSLAVNKRGNILAGTAGGIFISTDRGDHWRNSSEGLSVKDVWCLAITPTGEIFAGTNGGHVTSSEGSIFRSTENPSR